MSTPSEEEEGILVEIRQWSQKIWPIINRRRGVLIDRSIMFGPTMTKEEREELQTIQEYADYYIDRFVREEDDALNALEEVVANLVEEKPAKAPTRYPAFVLGPDMLEDSFEEEPLPIPDEHSPAVEPMVVGPSTWVGLSSWRNPRWHRQIRKKKTMRR